jgi:hypothetical protein
MVLLRRCGFRRYGWVLLLFASGLPLRAATHAAPVPVPEELRSTQFRVTLDGKPVDVAHAAASYDYVSFELTGPVTVSITALEKGFWDRGVDIQPWRLGIRPVRNGDTIQFKIDQPVKLSISRPRDFLNHAKMLFLFASRPPAGPPAGPEVHIVSAGVHRESINAKSGETWYFEPGAVVFGSINLFHVENVKVLGRGVVVYDGPQNPENDEGWMQKPDWHCIGALDAHHVEIHGLTCLIRSRTWSIQMKDSSSFLYDDLRVIGGNPGNANQDGMDWLGGGLTIVRDAFFRASDDVLAMQGNWDGYNEADLVRPGHDVGNILVERSELSTSISNIVRAGWPEKSYNSNGFTLRDSDVLASGIGSCGLPFALFTFWGAKDAAGSHSGFVFENIWLDDWYSLFQMQKDAPSLLGFTFRNVWALDQPPLASSLLAGHVEDVRIENVKYGQSVAVKDSEIPVNVVGGAREPEFARGEASVRASFQVKPEVLQPGEEAEFTAEPVPNEKAHRVRYNWLFGDGTTAQGRRVRHRFRDAEGTQLDGALTGAGRFRVLLEVESKETQGLSGGERPPQDWASQGVIVIQRWHEAEPEQSSLPGLLFQIYPGSWPDFPVFAKQVAMRNGIAVVPSIADAGGFTHFAATYEGLIDVPADGGFTFHLLARDGARLMIDNQTIAETGPPFAEVCGSDSNAVRYQRGTIGLRKGKHSFRYETLETVSAQFPRLLWEGPGVGMSEVPASAFSHRNEAVLEPADGKSGAPYTVGPSVKKP